jgi:hypothetical protein
MTADQLRIATMLEVADEIEAHKHDLCHHGQRVAERLVDELRWAATQGGEGHRWHPRTRHDLSYLLATKPS